MWFEQLFGFRERLWAETQAQFAVSGEELRSLANGRTFAIGKFSTPTLAALRAATQGSGQLRFAHEVIGDVLPMHAMPENAGAMFQVASQFNCLEFPGPATVPEDGVTGYAHDHTQGPACSLAAAAATVYRNYLLPFGSEPKVTLGQTRDRQLNNLDQLAELLRDPLFTVRNGYTFSTADQLNRLAQLVDGSDRAQLLGAVKIGVQSRVGVTFASRWVEPAAAPLVSQAFCSALSCAYVHSIPTDLWKPLATLVLDAAYEATLRAAAIDLAQGRGSGKVWLTSVGGGVFGNRTAWIASAIGRALQRCADLPLDVRLGHYLKLDAELCRGVEQARLG